ncbi:MAG TPA: hypothetical protein VMG63_13160 [Terriglobia bacterium]|nr:hypothetical protein [Terriglobia bacterium]
MVQPIVAKFRTFGEAEEATREYYRKLSPGERLEILFQLRALAHKEGDAPSGRLARFIESLNSNGVEYLIVGAVALAYHGFPRYTGDLDVLVRNSPGNTRRLESALAGFGFASLGLKAADFADSYRVIQLGVPPNRIDLLTSITGVPFDEAWGDRVDADLEGIRVSFISRQALIRNKRLTGRAQDKADLEVLGAGEE